MANLFAFLLLASLVMLVFGVMSPSKMTKTLKKDMNRKRSSLLFGGLSMLFFVLVGITAPADAQKDIQKTSGVKSETTTQTAPQPVITSHQVQTTEPVAFSTKTVDDNTLPKGQTKVTQIGQNGVKTLTYKVTYQDGAESYRELLSEQITTPAVDQIVHNGTYVKPAKSTSCSGGYVNVDGNCVQSPSSSPAGATAVCRDGTYSYSQHRSGTCSHHGGVAQWL